MEKTKHFKPKAHILRLLGDELIKNPIMAIYELIKNSYDADSDYVEVEFINIDNINEAIIRVKDNGIGLTSEVIENVWLEPGTAHRKPIDQNGKRSIAFSPLYNRVPMGEKGIGRFASHKLGNKIKLITRPSEIICVEGKKEKKLLDYEISLEIDWDRFSQIKYLDEIIIAWEIENDLKNFYFKDDSGTLIEISNLKESWTRGMARNLKRSTSSMLSPKIEELSFQIFLNFQNNWLENLPEPSEIIELAPYKYTALLDVNYNLSVDYEFSLSLNEDFGRRKIENKTENIRAKLISSLIDDLRKENIPENDIEEQIEKLKERINPFGDILLEIYSFDLDPTTLKNYTHNPKILKKILKEHSGIKVFKDDLRVFNYGEKGNDWLELDIRRVQNKSWYSNNQIIGYIFLDSKNSTKLIEKTNREGFIENSTYQIFYQSIIEIIDDFRVERLKDRNKWLNYINKASKSETNANYLNDLIDSTDFTVVEQKMKLKDEIVKLRNDLDEKRETLLIPAGVGMTTSVALHEIEKIVPILKEVINSNPFIKKAANDLIEDLEGYLNGILSVLRKGNKKPINLKNAIENAVSNYAMKLRRRKIELIYDFENDDLEIKCDKRFFITIIMNIIDNCIYWLDSTYKLEKSIFIKTVRDHSSTIIIIVDNGPGFKDDITDLVRPFFSRKKDGMGIGLYLIDTIMMNYGKLDIITSNEEFKDYDIPKRFHGAAIKLIFKDK